MARQERPGDRAFEMNIIDIDWTKILTHLMNVVIAYLLALPVAWDREKEARSAGLRTFPLVAVASCGYMLLATSILGSSSESTSRIIQGLITGIGFIGGGAILKDRGSVHGTATAASIWNTGAIGGRRSIRTLRDCAGIKCYQLRHFTAVDAAQA